MYNCLNKLLVMGALGMGLPVIALAGNASAFGGAEVQCRFLYSNPRL